MALQGTTIVAVQRNGVCAIAGDGQVTMGERTIMKGTAKKVRRLYHDQVVVGFAGSVADAFSLCEWFEAKLTQYGGSLRRAAVSLAKDWRSDKALRHLEALLIAADREDLKALKENTDLPAREIARKAIEIASEICVFTNGHITLEEV